MNEIFFSWASPDVRLAKLIFSRLRDAGLPVTEYSDDMVPGDDIPQWVVGRIEGSSVFVACVSADALAHSSWVKAEVDVASARYVRSGNRLARLVIIRIGQVADGWQSPLLPADRLRYYDIADPADSDAIESQVEVLVRHLHAALGTWAPLVVPTALYAMTREEFTLLRATIDPAQLHRLVALCRGVGMSDPPELWDELSGRHGDADRDFMPYADERTLIELAQNVANDVNLRRMDAGKNPVFLRWYSRSELKQAHIRDLWRNERTLLFVDSLSSLYPAVRDCLHTLPQPKDARKAAVIHLPPYTRRTGELERLIEENLDGQAFLSDTFRAWQNENDLASLAFDLPTETSMKRWLDQLLLADFQRDPVPRKVGQMAPGTLVRLPPMTGVPGALR